MRTFNLQEAAAFLHMHQEEVRRRAKCGELPGAKPGRAWVFLEEALAEWMRGLYARPRQALRVTRSKEYESCHSSNAGTPGGSTSSPLTDSEYAALLGLEAKPRRGSSTTS